MEMVNSPFKKLKLIDLELQSFIVNDPIHGTIHLPEIIKIIIDEPIFQRMRHIKQLGLLSLIYPSATHNRFFHSIGTAFLAKELIKNLKYKQPELNIDNSDILCVIIAGLCHDLGHLCYSHLFEVFIHELGVYKRENDDLTDIELYENWNHEDGSIMLLKELYKKLNIKLNSIGLCKQDYICIEELIKPPKKKLHELLDSNRLKEEWSNVIKGRSVEKAWMYEIISNWRSGIDVDKFDYFRRDALYLGIQIQFDHNRYINSVRVIKDENDVYTISPPEKFKDYLEENMMGLRRTLHLNAYQNKTVKKMECHMINILKKLDDALILRSKYCKMSKAIVNFDPIVYSNLTDTYIESKILYNESPRFSSIKELNEKHIINRKLMNLIGVKDVYNNELDKNDIIKALSKVKNVNTKQLYCCVVDINHGINYKNIVFHNKYNNNGIKFNIDQNVRKKIFVFYDNDNKETLNFLVDLFNFEFF